MNDNDFTPTLPTPEQEVVIDALAAAAVRETETILLAATLLIAAAAKLMFHNYPPKQAVSYMDTIMDGAREAVRSVMH